MDERKILNGMKIIAIIVLMISVASFIFVMGMDFLEKREAELDIRVGTIVDKEIVTVTNLFAESEMQWRIYIEGEYEYDNETHTGETFYNVTEDIYLSYNIGEEFDITSYDKGNINEIFGGDKMSDLKYVLVVCIAIMTLTLMCLLFTYLEYLYYNRTDERFKDYTFKQYVKERGIF